MNIPSPSPAWRTEGVDGNIHTNWLEQFVHILGGGVTRSFRRVPPPGSKVRMIRSPGFGLGGL